MANTVIVGTQWGDEGKGKVVDLLSEHADYVVRFQGGNNAGHTMVVDGKQTITHLIPSGIIQQKKCFIGNGLTVNPFDLLDEIKGLNAAGIKVDPYLLFISDRAHMIMPYHIALDKAKESKKGDGKIGTTGRGIGPCYEDKSARRGVRFIDILDPAYLQKRIKSAMEFHNFLLTQYYKVKPVNVNMIIDKIMSVRKELIPYIADVSTCLHEGMDAGKSIIFEGAQGVHLDIDHGTYPFVTSSAVASGNAANGSGVGPTDIDAVIGIVKAYTTRVGEGPFLTELLDETGDVLQKVGAEFGATTGRKRRCGWLDLVVVKNAARLLGLTNIALTKLDVLSGFETIKICTGYRLPNGMVIDTFPADLKALELYEASYIEMPGWKENITSITSFSDLPIEAQNYIGYIVEKTKTSVDIVSVGPGREQTIMCGNL